MSHRSSMLVPIPVVPGTHCAGIGCEHDELLGSGVEPAAPLARTTARHRRSVNGRRAHLRLATAPVSPRAAAHSA